MRFGRSLVAKSCGAPVEQDAGIMQLAPGSVTRLDVLAAWQSHSIAAWARPGLFDVLEHGGHLYRVLMRGSCIDQARGDDPQVATALCVVSRW